MSLINKNDIKVNYMLFQVILHKKQLEIKKVNILD